MASHFIHYLKRQVIIRFPQNEADPFFAQYQNGIDGFERPMYHITRRTTGPATRIGPGSVIWLFSVLRSPWGDLPPSLDAKFVVDRVEALPDRRLKFYAARSSVWYPVADATVLLQTLRTVNQNGESRLWADASKPIGFYLQSMRQLSNGDRPEKWASKIILSGYDFISYRIKDGTKAAFLKTKELIEQGNIVFWDRFCLPRRLAERRELVSDAALDSYLMDKLAGSSKVWGIESKLYHVVNSYAFKEAEAAKAQGNYVGVRG